MLSPFSYQPREATLTVALTRAFRSHFRPSKATDAREDNHAICSVNGC